MIGIWSTFIGTFGQVLECWDQKSKDFVAIKIVRGLQKYREAAMIEIDVLREVAKHDRTGTRYERMNICRDMPFS